MNGGFPRVILAGADTFGLNASIEAAQALGEMFGLQAALTLQRRVLGMRFNDLTAGDFRRLDAPTTWTSISSAEWDGMRLHVPIAAILEYELNGRLGGTGNEELEGEATNTHTLRAGVYYSRVYAPTSRSASSLQQVRNLRRASPASPSPAHRGSIDTPKRAVRRDGHPVHLVSDVTRPA